MSDAGHTSGKPRVSDRRGGDRRVADVPFEGAERRADERRTGRDRRAEARTRLQH